MYDKSFTLIIHIVINIKKFSHNKLSKDHAYIVTAIGFSHMEIAVNDIYGKWDF